MAWQSIETAPKDGTRILVNDAPCVGVDVVIGYWKRGEWIHASDAQYECGNSIKPTLWHPIEPLP